MSLSEFRPRTGLVGYDTARFRAPRPAEAPVTVLGVLRHGRLPGFGALVAEERYEEVDVPPLPAHVLLVMPEDRPWMTGGLTGHREPHATRRAEAAILPAGSTSHWQLRGRAARVLQFHLDPAALAEWNEDPAPAELRPEPLLRDPALWSIAQAAEREIEQPGAAGHLVVGSLALSIGAHLLRHYGTAARPAAPSRGGLAPWQVRRVLEFMQDHHAEDLALADLAALVGLSQFHFARAFRQSVGAPPARHLTTIRLERARQLLADPRIPVTEIAGLVGYDSAQTFARAFRREHGTSPTDWRREHGG